MTTIIFAWKIFFLCFSVAYAQPPNVINIENNGLSELNRQYSLFVNNEGLLFIGANDGMFTFDGVHYKSLQSTSIISKAINEIKSDNVNKVWCKSFSDELFFVKNDSLVIHKEITSYLHKTSENLVDFVIYENDIYFLTKRQLVRYSADEGISVLISSSSSSKMNALVTQKHLTSIERSGTTIFIASTDEIYMYDIKTRELKVEQVFNGQKVLTIHKQMLYMIIKGGAQKVSNIYGNPLVVSNLKSNTIFYNIKSCGDDLWLCTSDGLYSLTHHFWILQGERVSDIVNDLEGGLWISTLDKGLFYIPDTKIKNILTTKNNNEQFTRIILRNNKVYAGTNKGKIFVYDKNNKESFIISPKVEREVEAFFLHENYLYSSAGLYDLDVRKYLNNSYYGKHLVMDDVGNLLNANSGFAALLPFGENQKPILSHTMKRSRLTDFGGGDCMIYPFRYNRSNAVHFCNINKCYYMAYSDGLRIFFSNGDEREIYMPNGSKIIATSFASDSLGNTYIGTINQGLVVLNEDQLIENITDDRGLSNNYCRRVYFNDGDIWVLTKNDLDLIHDSKVTNVGAKLAASHIEIKDIAFQDNNLFLASKSGIIKTEKSTFSSETLLPIPKIKSYNGTGEILPGSKLSYSQNSIRFVLQATFYGTFGNYLYEYRIKELNPEWQEQPSNINYVNYLSFSPGNYTFETRLRVGNQVSDIASIGFTINKPFWMQTWFLFIMVFLVFGIVIFFINSSLRRIKRKEQTKTALAESQITALRSQMNPHFLFNVLNAVQGYIFSNEKVKASNYIGGFSDLMRKILQFSDQLEIPLSEELKTIELYVELEKARFEDEFLFEMQKEQKLDLKEYLVPSLILQPFVENAIKHGLRHKEGKKHLIMKIGEQEEFIKIIITDNGIGRKKSAIINKHLQKHTSYAISSIDKRINLINSLNDNNIKYTIDDVNSNVDNTGTRVEIWIPKKKRNESNNR